MLALFRRSLNTWPARVLFALLVAAFGMWGVADVVRNIGHDSSIASVAGHQIEAPELQEAYRRDLAQAQRMMGNTDPTPEIRRMVAVQAVQQLVTQYALEAEAHGMGVTVTDDAVRAAAFDEHAFRGANGQFDRATMDNVLRNSGLTEAAYLGMLRHDLVQRQVLSAVQAGASAPAVMADQVFAYQQEKRVADAVDVPFAAAPPPPAPTDTQLQRWWANNPEKFSSPEYRRISAIVLAPETLASEIQISDDDLKTAYDQHKAEYSKPERRSVQVLLTQDEATAKQLAGQWAAGADWAAIQQAATKVGAAPVALDDATRGEFPAPELGTAVFAAAEGVVAPPVHSALGWHVLKVTRITPATSQSFEEARDALRKRAIAEKAADLIYDRANQIENLLSAGTTLEHLPSGLGVAAVTGTLDAQGNTPAGKPAPIPGPAELRAAIVQAAFQAKKGDPAKLTQGPNETDGSQTFYALTVDDITAPAPRPFADVADAVRADWTKDQVRHEQEIRAANLLEAVKAGHTLAAAAAKDGLTVRRLPATGRATPPDGFPTPLLAPLFGLKQGELTMVETPDGFVVAQLVEIQQPDPKADPVGFGQVRDALSRAIAQDLETTFANAVRDRAKPHVNLDAVASLVGSGE
jgi:peptidyl-prolyl cis-trans isomerase D